jgi:hypothetical protein
MIFSGNSHQRAYYEPPSNEASEAFSAYRHILPSFFSYLLRAAGYKIPARREFLEHREPNPGKESVVIGRRTCDSGKKNVRWFQTPGCVGPDRIMMIIL